MSRVRRRARAAPAAPARRAELCVYGLYFLDAGRAGRRGAPFQCRSDADAQRYAEQRREGRRAQLRQGDRLVMTWASGEAPGARPDPLS